MRPSSTASGNSDTTCSQQHLRASHSLQQTWQQSPSRLKSESQADNKPQPHWQQGHHEGRQHGTQQQQSHQNAGSEAKPSLFLRLRPPLYPAPIVIAQQARCPVWILALDDLPCPWTAVKAQDISTLDLLSSMLMSMCWK